MSVAFDANATADSTANGVTSINHANLTIGSGSNRALVAQILWDNTTAPTATVKWDNAGTPQTMTSITGAAKGNTNVNVQLFGLVAPTSGNKTLNAAWSGARDVYLNGVSWTGVDQTGGATSFPHGTGGTGTSTTASTGAITSATGNAVMGVHGTSTASVNSMDNTQTFRDNVAANISGGGNRAAGAATVTLTATLSASAAWASAGTDIAAAASVAFIAAEPLIVRQAVNRAGTY